MSEQTVIGGFTVIFNGVTPVAGGFEWSYTIINNGTEKDLSNWVLELKNCVEGVEKLPCSLGKCEIENQVCPPNSGDCTTFRGIKFDNLPGKRPVQTFTFVLPQAAVPTVGCFYLKYGLNRVCGQIPVPDCSGDPPCPPCPKESLREGKTFKYQVELPLSKCELDFSGCDHPSFYLCVNGIKMEYGICDQLTEVTLCDDTESEQMLNCYVRLDYLQLSGKLQIIWQLRGELQTLCAPRPVPLSLLAITDVDVTEICFFCEGERPDFSEDELCDWFAVRFINLSASGLLTYEVKFLGCSEGREE